MYNIKRIKGINSVFFLDIIELDQSNFDVVFQTCVRRCFFRILIYLISFTIIPEFAGIENAELTGLGVQNTQKVTIMRKK